MARKKKLHPFEVRVELLTMLVSSGYSLQKLRKEGPNADDSLACLLYKAYECLGQQEEALADLGVRLTLAERGKL